MSVSYFIPKALILAFTSSTLSATHFLLCWREVDRFHFLLISLILVTFLSDYAVILLGESRCWSPLRVKVLEHSFIWLLFQGLGLAAIPNVFSLFFYLRNYFKRFWIKRGPLYICEVKCNPTAHMNFSAWKHGVVCLFFTLDSLWDSRYSPVSVLIRFTAYVRRDSHTRRSKYGCVCKRCPRNHCKSLSTTNRLNFSPLFDSVQNRSLWSKEIFVCYVEPNMAVRFWSTRKLIRSNPNFAQIL